MVSSTSVCSHPPGPKACLSAAAGAALRRLGHSSRGLMPVMNTPPGSVLAGEGRSPGAASWDESPQPSGQSYRMHVRLPQCGTWLKLDVPKMQQDSSHGFAAAAAAAVEKEGDQKYRVGVQLIKDQLADALS
eukprot:7958399-Pyramimonas_sp.AAC.1